MKAIAPAQPYKYFAYFKKEDRDIFFGRRREIEVLLADIVTTRLVVLFARSGTGKSSLINAGVRPRLEDRNYRTLIARVGSDPAKSVRDAAADEGLKLPPSTPSFAELLIGIVEAAKRPLVLFLDQFEEFFLNDISDETRRAFIADVGLLYRTKDAGVHLVVSMREDYLAELDAFRDEIPAIFEKESQLRLRLLTPEQAKEAIEGPAAVVALPFDFEPGLVDRIVAELPREHGLIQPVAVQIVCDTLWNEKDGLLITYGLYETLGKAGGIIEARVTKDVDEHLDFQQIAMLELAIDSMHTKDWTKRPVSESELMLATHVTMPEVRSFMRAIDSSGLAHIDTRGSHGTDVSIEWVSDYISELSRDMRPNLRRIWLRKVRQSGTPFVVSRERTAQLLEDATFLRMLDDEEWSFMLRAASETRDALGQWRRALEASGRNPWPLIGRALDDGSISEDSAARLMQYLGEASGGPPVDILARQLTKPARIRTALRALGAVRDPGAIDAIKPFLEQEEWQIAALDALRTIATPEAIVLADSVQKRGSRLFDRLSKTAELHGMEDEERWSQIIEGVASGQTVGVIGAALWGQSMLKRLTTHFEYPFSEPTDVRTVIDYLSVNFGTGWQKLLMEGEGEVPSAYRALATLPIQRWLTTDYTDQFEQALELQGKKAQTDVPAEFTKSPSVETVVIHMLGFVGFPSSIMEKPLAITLIDAIRDSLFQLNMSSLIVFGFDREDPEVSIIRRELGLRSRSIPTLTIAPSPELANSRQLGRAQEYFAQYGRSRGVSYYWGTPEEFVEEFHRRMGPEE